MTPQTEIAPLLHDLTALIALIDKFPCHLDTYEPGRALRDATWSITAHLDWLARNWHTPRACPSCSKTTTIAPGRPRQNERGAIVRVPKSGFRPRKPRIAPKQSPTAFQKNRNPSVLMLRSPLGGHSTPRPPAQLTFL
jgi:hypothetical protein